MTERSLKLIIADANTSEVLETAFTTGEASNLLNQIEAHTILWDSLEEMHDDITANFQNGPDLEDLSHG